MMLKCNFIGMLKMSIVWQKNVQIKIAKSTYTAAFIYATRICRRKVCLLWKYFPEIQQSQNTYKKSSGRKQCVFYGNMFRKSSNLKIHIRKVHEVLLQEK